jgi:ectoine hydroxylase-related dioxygenase (phytanoyl-CoA dioxygenase family)
VRDPSLLGEAVACPLAPGGATVHAARTLHHTGPNTTDEPRRALILAFRAPPTLRGDDRSFPWQPASWYDD